MARQCDRLGLINPCIILRTLLAGLTLIALDGSTAMAYKAAPMRDLTTTEADAPTESKEVEQEKRERQKSKVTIGLLIVALVTACGIGLLAFTILGGNAARRGVRRDVVEEKGRASTTSAASPPKAPDESDDVEASSDALPTDEAQG